MAYNKESLEKALDYFHLESIDVDIIKGNEEKLIYCAENGKESYDFDCWIRYEELLKEKLSYEEYISLHRSFGIEPFEINLSDCDLLHGFRKHLEESRGLNDNFIDEEEIDDKTMVVLLVKPGEKPVLTVIDGSLESKQKLVGGWIERFMPFEDDVAIICNEEGKLSNLPLNRAVRYEDGTILDIMAGDFFMCYAPEYSSNFLSLPPEMIYKYATLFEHPEDFYMLGGKVFAESYLDSFDNSFLGVNYEITKTKGSYEIDFSVFDEDKCEDVKINHLSFNKDSFTDIEITGIAKEQAAELSIDSAYKYKEEFNKEHTLDALISSAADKVRDSSDVKEATEPDLDI